MDCCEIGGAGLVFALFFITNFKIFCFLGFLRKESHFSKAKLKEQI